METTETSGINHNPALSERALSLLKEEHFSAEDWLQSRWEAEIRLGFSVLRGLTPLLGAKLDRNNPKISQLLDYGESIEEKFEYVRKSVGLTPQRAELLMGRISKEDRGAGFAATVLTLKRETEYLRELEDVGISVALLEGLEKGKYGAFTLFVAPDSFYAQIMRKAKTRAAYLPIMDTVIIPRKAPSTKEMWLMLATEGTFPEVVASLDHELTHDAQWSKKQRALILSLSSVQSISYYAIVQKYGVAVALAFSNALGFLSRRLSRKLGNDELLGEIHSFEASASSPTYAGKGINTKEQIARHVINAYRPKEKTIMDALLAYDLIHTLRILGLDDKEIGRLVNRAKFDKKTGTFPLLEKAILDKREEWGIKDGATFSLVVNALRAQHFLELRYQRHRAQEVAARELRRETGEWLGK